MGLCLFFFLNFPGATFIQGGTFIPDFRVHVAERVEHDIENNIQCKTQN